MSMGLCNWAPQPPSSSSLSRPTSSAQTTAFFDAMLGRQPSSAPAHLTSVLYIPLHDHNTTHLPMYEAGDSYRDAVGGSKMGSTLYSFKLSTMARPRGDGTSHRVAYHANMQRPAAVDDGVMISAQKRELGNQGAETRLTLPPSSNGAPQRILIESPEGSIEMDTFFPIPPSARGSNKIHHPYFGLDVPLARDIAPTRLEWQVHPVENGPLRYTLANKDAPACIHAIYYDAGCSKILSHGSSEGVLLLPERSEGKEETAAMEGIVVASILGVLWQVRTLHGATSVPPKRAKHIGQFHRVVSCFHT
ncbi:hypothetical protein PG987_006460 [Apiospora arundinis]